MIWRTERSWDKTHKKNTPNKQKATNAQSVLTRSTIRCEREPRSGGLWRCNAHSQALPVPLRFADLGFVDASGVLLVRLPGAGGQQPIGTAAAQATNGAASSTVPVEAPGVGQYGSQCAGPPSYPGLNATLERAFIANEFAPAGIRPVLSWCFSLRIAGPCA